LFRRPFAARFCRVCRRVLRSVCCCCRCCPPPPPPPSLSPPRRIRRLWKNFDGMMILIYSENKKKRDINVRVCACARAEKCLPSSRRRVNRVRKNAQKERSGERNEEKR